jgi:3-mercaptopyruvate sulfurtransferase SseA
MTSRRNIRYCLLFASMLLVASFTSFTAFAQEGMPEDEAMGEGGQQHEYPRMSVEELKKLIDSKNMGNVLVVDNSPKEAYDDGHIPGAVNFPWASQVKPPITLPRNKTLVMYCPCTHEEDSTDMANKLRTFGYFNIKLLDGGWFKWEEMKYPIEKAKAN